MSKTSSSRRPALLIKTAVAICGSALCVAVLLKAPLWGVCILLSLVAGLAGYELTAATGFVKHRYLIALSVLQAVAVIWAVYFELPLAGWLLWLFCAFLLAFTPGVFSEKAASAQEGIAAVFASFVVPGITALFLVLLQPDNNRYNLLIPLVAAWSGDSLALLGGMAFGKHKLNPRISPNKTVEGFFCAIVGGVLGMVIYGLILRACGHEVSLGLYAIIGAVGAIFGAMGDLTFSSIKRSVGIKDFGKLMPEHGGILDRFDSVLFVLPVVAAVFLLA